jgi:hypothetical protein
MIHHLPRRHTSRAPKKDKLITPQLLGLIVSTRGRVLPPLLLYLLGVPGVIVILLWIFVFRG